MRLLYCGDIMGRPGRDAVLTYVPQLRRDLGLDFVVACGENAAHGFGITAAICQSLYDAGVDVITLGNHAWDQREIISYISAESRLLRPLNYPPEAPGRGLGLYTTAKGQRVIVVQVMCRLFMDPLDDPFRALDGCLEQHPLRDAADAIIVDVHGEATSEKGALAHVADGRASMVVGSHSHIPTADTRIMPGGTAFQTDAGMCGPFDSVIGMNKHTATQRFVTKMPTDRLEPADAEGTLCGVYVETDDHTGLALRAEPVRLGGSLRQSLPS
ncbi:MAG: YmdB family metallophosphoesterase [Rhodospirillaceae bacterium]|nr:YmdB family metallophosphoesterase [Rhodospirillaceae bacterium]